MAQRKRAGLITLRTQDRNLLPVFYTLSALQKPMVIAHATYKLEYCVPGIAQR